MLALSQPDSKYVLIEYQLVWFQYNIWIELFVLVK